MRDHKAGNGRERGISCRMCIRDIHFGQGRVLLFVVFGKRSMTKPCPSIQSTWLFGRLPVFIRSRSKACVLFSHDIPILHHFWSCELLPTTQGKRTVRISSSEWLNQLLSGRGSVDT